MKVNNPELEKAVVSDYLNGLKAKDIMARNNIGKNTLWKILNNNHIEFRNEKKKITCGDEIKALFDKGMFAKEIAEKLDMETRSVENYIRNHNLKRPLGFDRKVKRGGNALPPEIVRKKSEPKVKPKFVIAEPISEIVESGQTKVITSKGDTVIINDKPIACTPSLSRKCIYGKATAPTDASKCNFAGCVGCTKQSLKDVPVHAPSINNNFCECYFFQRITKENPRRKLKVGSL